MEKTKTVKIKGNGGYRVIKPDSSAKVVDVKPNGAVLKVRHVSGNYVNLFFFTDEIQGLE